MKITRHITVLGITTAAAIGLGQQALAGSILLTEFDYGPTAYTDMKSNLEADGHTVTIVNAKIAGNLALALTGNSYDSLFVWDLTATRYLDQSDLDAVEDFYGDHSSLVLDSRSYGYYFQGNQASEVNLLQNVASTLDSFGGGLWIGTDHDPDWTLNANPILSQLGFDTITGSHSDAVNDYDPASVLLVDVTVSELWASGASVGNVSLGIQPNGVDMRFHVGHSSPAAGAIPYISASFGNYIAPDEDPDDHNNGNPVPEPSLPALLGLALASVFATRKVARKS